MSFREFLRLCNLALGLSLIAAAADAPQDGERWWKHVQYLADDRLAGRYLGTVEESRGAAYVAQELERIGLKPAGSFGYSQPVKFLAQRIRDGESSVKLVGKRGAKPLRLWEDLYLELAPETAESLEAELVFVGHGLVAPEKNYDDLKGVDLRGKIALYLEGVPASIPAPLRYHCSSAPERWKSLKDAGAIGTATIGYPAPIELPGTQPLIALPRAFFSLAEESLWRTPGRKLSMRINPARVDKFFEGTGHTWSGPLGLSRIAFNLPKFPLAQSLQVQVRFERMAFRSQNVVAVLSGSDPDLGSEYIVVSAHVDHIGECREVRGDNICNGTMDNAVGVASLLETARLLKESRKTLLRSVLFLACTGEEEGLLGSRYFTAHPTVPLHKIVADLNLDMFLPLYPLRTLIGIGMDESDLGERLAGVARDLGVQAQAPPERQRGLFFRSDQLNFAYAGVPSLAFLFGCKGGSQERIQREWLSKHYHACSDDPGQPVDLDAGAHFNRLIAGLVEQIANQPERPRWKSSSLFGLVRGKKEAVVLQ